MVLFSNLTLIFVNCQQMKTVSSHKACLVGKNLVELSNCLCFQLDSSCFARSSPLYKMCLFCLYEVSHNHTSDWTKQIYRTANARWFSKQNTAITQSVSAVLFHASALLLSKLLFTAIATSCEKPNQMAHQIRFTLCSQVCSVL